LAPPVNRREVIAASATALMLESGVARAALVRGGLPFRPSGTNPPDGASPGAWQFFTPEEGATVEAIVDRLIPADALSPGGKDVGCTVYIDRQLAGPYGHFGGYYMKGPFQRGTPQQGEQSNVTFAERYRKALAALDGSPRWTITAVRHSACDSPTCPTTVRTKSSGTSRTTG
jgi:gluconate 2-dehydrogenase gamma chain